ncbi:hypothetical protein BJF85_17305 [Saccharomonospora sp. CUA-673]|uniref:hypothetical protein n=1 Tax=Saccharomonospora sp. CUA-673 TaxID=1904969 RepID=UPI00095AE535|nr:hypothetical protein [Saccharomonospora sp. CUA-673]OLT46378.1 hypothetical protein BJF85_17305 [Saccharomonospora sp. CUA-673]
MITGYALAVSGGAAAVAVWAFVLVALNRPPEKPLLIGIGVIEALLAIQVLISIVMLIAGGEPGSLVTFLAYLFGSLLVLPLGTVWALAERTRSSTAVLGVALLTVPVLMLRMVEVWGGASA